MVASRLSRLVCLLTLTLAALSMALTPVAAAERPAAYRSDLVPAAPSYTLPAALPSLTNADALAKLTDEQKARLATQGFVVIPDAAMQMFYHYEDYPRGTEQPVPNFITVDSVLHAYHLFFSYSLRSVENNHLAAALAKLTDICLGHSVKFYKQLKPGALREAAAADAVYFAVAKSLLGGKRVSTGLGTAPDALVGKELALIAAHAGRSTSPLLGTTVHYSQFIPRGHYTRNDVLKKYFMAMMWYGSLGLALDPDDGEALAAQHTGMALLITRMLSADDNARALWAKIYEPTAFFVGTSDDLGYQQYAPVARQIFGQQVSLETMADDAKRAQFLAQARADLPGPRIAPFFLDADAEGNLDLDSGKVQSRQFRFMGQRFIPDSYILQQLVTPLVKPVGPDDARDMPLGLDVMAALGSDRALDLLLSKYDQGRYPNYREQMTKLRQEFATKPESQWWQNLYWGWLYSFKALLGNVGQGYPVFMQGTPWQDKQLQTSLGSWSQLRHDTILYGKPSGAEMGAGEEHSPRGYVEPVPEAFARLAYLTVLSQEGLQRRGLLDKNMGATFDKLKNLLMFLKACAEKELTGQPLSQESYDRIQYFGGEIERLQLSVVRNTTDNVNMTNWYEITNETDRHMATIADIHTSFNSALEVGVGPAYRLYVIVPRADGKLQVTKGGVFSYYEFTWPASDRLTDEKWQALLKTPEAPRQQDWLQSIVVGPAYPGDWD